MSFLRYSAPNNGVTLKSELQVNQRHWKWYHSKAWYGFLFIVHSNYGRIFSCFDTIHVRDGRQTDTARRHRPRLCIASRGKKSLESAPVSRIPLAPAERSETCLTTPLNNSKAVLTHYLGHILNDNLRDDDDIQRECMCVQIFYYVNLVNAVLM